MGIFDKFERKLEGAVSGAFAKAFRSSVEPVEIASQLQHELGKNAKIVTRGRTIVPNDFHVELSPNDYDRLASMGTPLAAEFVGVLQEHAQQQNYAFTGPVRVELERQDDLDTGLFRIRAEVAAAAPQTQRATPPAEPAMPQPRPRDQPQPPILPPIQPIQPPVQAVAPPPAQPAIYLEVAGRRYPITAPGMMIGRATDCDLRLEDSGASRRHAEIRVLPTGNEISLQIVDLGSTNGTRVDGRRIDSAYLTEGSQITIGNTTMTVVAGGR